MKLKISRFPFTVFAYAEDKKKKILMTCKVSIEDSNFEANFRLRTLVNVEPIA